VIERALYQDRRKPANEGRSALSRAITIEKVKDDMLIIGLLAFEAKAIEICPFDRAGVQ
jgi:hypothetical protein